MFFKDIPGHQNFKHELVKLTKAERIPHAMLFLGPKGNASLGCAIALANYLQCENKGEDRCGTCKSCLKTSKLIHPDIHFAFPVVKKGTLKRDETISSHFLEEWRTFILERPFEGLQAWIQYISTTTTTANINKAECNDITHHLGLQSFEGSYKIQIIWMAEYLAKESNRLLKLIEEPTDNTILILIAEDQHKILSTIVSRCQTFNLPKFKDEEIGAFLDSKELDNLTNKEEIIRLAFGNIEKAIELSQNSHIQYADVLLEWMRIAWKAHPKDVFGWVTKIAQKSKEEIKNFYLYGLHFFREYLVYLYTQDNFKMRLSNKEKDTALKMVKIIDIDKAQKLSLMFEESLRLIDRNINVKLLFSENSFRLEKIMKN